MKILHVTNYDNLGGAGIAAHRLHTALRKAGIDSRMLVRRKGSNDPTVEEVGSFVPVDSCSLMVDKGKLRQPIIQQLNNCRVRLMVRARGWLGTKVTRLLGMEGCSLNILPTGLHRALNASDTDVIHLHWINNEMISIKEIAKIKKPIVWTLHDCWPLLGAEHHSFAGAESQKSGDGLNDFTVQRGAIRRFNAVARAVNGYIFRLKKRAWKQLRVHFIAPSNWMAEQVRQSQLFADAPVTVIPNCLDLEIFQPLDLSHDDGESAFGISPESVAIDNFPQKITSDASGSKKRSEGKRQQSECRKKLGLPHTKKLILFGAYNPMDPNKGLDLLEEALWLLPNDVRDGMGVVVFGDKNSIKVGGLETFWLGAVGSEQEMAQVYNAGDLTCVPSRQETLPTVIAESISCGVSCVGFRVGGIPDMIEHRITGWLAEPFDKEDLANGISWGLIGNQQSAIGNQALSAACRQKAKELFSSGSAVRRHIAVYEPLMHVLNPDLCEDS